MARVILEGYTSSLRVYAGDHGHVILTPVCWKSYHRRVLSVVNLFTPLESGTWNSGEFARDLLWTAVDLVLSERRQ